MPDISGSSLVKVQPNTANMPISLTLTVCSSATANDGQIPYGDTLDSAVVKAYDPDGNDVASSMVTTGASVSGNTITCSISYYDGIASGAGVLGRHKLTFIYTCASGYADEIDANRVQVQDT